MGDNGIVLRYMGDGTQAWSCVPPRDLTQEDLENVEAISHDKATILEFARFADGRPLYEEVTEDGGNSQ